MENTADTGTTLSERLHSVLRRIQDRTGDMPVVVSAGFLRWVAEAANQMVPQSDVAELYNQNERLTRERDEARESALQIKAHSDRVSEQLELANVSIATLTDRVAKLREARSTRTEKPAATSKK